MAVGLFGLSFGVLAAQTGLSLLQAEAVVAEVAGGMARHPYDREGRAARPAPVTITTRRAAPSESARSRARRSAGRVADENCVMRGA